MRDHIEAERRTHGIRTETDETRDVVIVSRFAGVSDKAGAHSLTFANQMIVNRSYRRAASVLALQIAQASRSLMTRIEQPASTASLARRQSSAIACFKPAPPFEMSKRAGRMSNSEGSDRFAWSTIPARRQRELDSTDLISFASAGGSAVEVCARSEKRG